MSNNVLVIYHDADYDGKCSAAIVAGAFEEVDFYGWDHYREIDWELISKYKTVIMVDIAFPDAFQMLSLKNEHDFIWIDHHNTSIEKYGKLEIKGLQDIGKGACQLCWEYFFPHIEIPKAVKYLADYDIWNHSDDKTLPFQYGMRYVDVKPEDSVTWKNLFDSGNMFDEVLNVGYICFEFEKSNNAYQAKSAFEVEFQGHKCIALNGGRGSLVFDSVGGRDYDIMITINYSDGSWSVSMYNDNKNVDVGEIAKYFGGGGHKGAAGFKCTTDQITSIGLVK